MVAGADRMVDGLVEQTEGGSEVLLEIEGGTE